MMMQLMMERQNLHAGVELQLKCEAIGLCQLQHSMQVVSPCSGSAMMGCSYTSYSSVEMSYMQNKLQLIATMEPQNYLKV